MRKPPQAAALSPSASPSPSRVAQRGGFFLGLVVGVLLGLAVALGVALYVTKVPVPFINKVPQRTAEQDAAEAVRNKDWDPNAPLAGKNPARPAVAASGAVTPGTSPAAAPAPAAASAPTAAASGPGAAPAPAPAASKGAAVPPGDKAASAAGGAEAFVYFVQAGAYARVEEAEAQRAKLAIRGFESRITEREQSGRTIYRVRIGPFEGRPEAEGVQGTLTDAGVETALVRVQK